MSKAKHDLSRLSDEYRRAYERGWRYSASETAQLDHLDSIGAPDAAYDGYLDQGSAREKWHLAFCSGCDEHKPHVPPVDRVTS